MKINAEGKKLFSIWEQNYYKENDKLGGNSAENDFVEGWCIIDNHEYIHNITDECGLFLFGYDDDALNQIDELIELYGENDICSYDYTFGDLKKELEKYFEE